MSNLIERIISYFQPVLAIKRNQERAKAEWIKTQKESQRRSSWFWK